MLLISGNATTTKERKKIKEILEKFKIVSYHIYKIGKFYKFDIISTNELSGKIVDELQKLGLGKSFEKGITIQKIEGTLPLLRKKETTPKISEEELSSTLFDSCKMNWIYLSFISISAIIIALGILDNNLIAIIGGMLIAPLLYPMIGSSFYIVTTSLSGFKKAISSEILGLVLAIGWGAVIALIVPATIKNLSYNIALNYYTIGVAIFAGFAGTLSITTRTLESLSGVAISVALMPPTVLVGIALGLSNFSLALSALKLAAVNVLAIHLTAIIVLKILDYGHKA